MQIPQTTLKGIVKIALQEDLGRGDITTDACLDPELNGEAHLKSRQQLTFCGCPVVKEVYRQVDEAVQITPLCEEGQSLRSGDTALILKGSAASILKGERVALNFLQHMCGIASLAHTYVNQLPKDSATRITDTRKTTPGLRVLERYAVRCGGAHNHREDLSSAVLIKDNHIAACGGIRQAMERVRARAPHTSRLTCEVDTIEQHQEALQCGADVVMLDNFDDRHLMQAVKLVSKRALVEVSGSIKLDRINKIANCGVDIISVGALTHSAPAVDLGLDWQAGRTL